MKFLGLQQASALTHMFDAEFRAHITAVDDKSAYANYKRPSATAATCTYFLQNFNGQYRGHPLHDHLETRCQDNGENSAVAAQGIEDDDQA